MNTMQTLKAAVVITLGIGCAAAAFTLNKANAVSGTAKVAYSATTTASGDTMPVVTVTAKKLTATQKVVLAMRDAAQGNARKQS